MPAASPPSNSRAEQHLDPTARNRPAGTPAPSRPSRERAAICAVPVTDRPQIQHGRGEAEGSPPQQGRAGSWLASNASPMSGSATLATARFEVRHRGHQDQREQHLLSAQHLSPHLTLRDEGHEGDRVGDRYPDGAERRPAVLVGQVERDDDINDEERAVDRFQIATAAPMSSTYLSTIAAHRISRPQPTTKAAIRYRLKADRIFGGAPGRPAETRHWTRFLA